MDFQPSFRATQSHMLKVGPLAAIADQHRLACEHLLELAGTSPCGLIERDRSHILRMAVDAPFRHIHRTTSLDRCRRDFRSSFGTTCNQRWHDNQRDHEPVTPTQRFGKTCGKPHANAGDDDEHDRHTLQFASHRDTIGRTKPSGDRKNPRCSPCRCTRNIRTREPTRHRHQHRRIQRHTEWIKPTRDAATIRRIHQQRRQRQQSPRTKHEPTPRGFFHPPPGKQSPAKMQRSVAP